MNRPRRKGGREGGRQAGGNYPRHAILNDKERAHELPEGKQVIALDFSLNNSRNWKAGEGYLPTLERKLFSP